MQTLTLVNPADGTALGGIPACSVVEVDRAVDAAAEALRSWSDTAWDERARLLLRMADELDARADRMARDITHEMGAPLTESRRIQVPLGIRTFRRTAEILSGISPREELDSTVVHRTGVGVVGCLTPWNYPLYLVATKVAPALAAGCTVVIKPSELAPGSALHLAEVAHRAGLPPGVVNVVLGDGPTTGRALAEHRRLDALSFTGSAAVGRQVAAWAGAALTRVTLELGGKSPSVLLPDADLEPAVTATVQKAFQNAGQTCAALTRLLVPRVRLGDVADLASGCARRYVPGLPADPGTVLGPLASETQRARVVGYIRSGTEQGARLVTGGPDRVDGLEAGAYVRPTVFTDVPPDAAIATEEIFGPVLSLIPYDTEDEAARIADGVGSGLSAAVWSRDEERAQRLARGLRVGSVSLNGAPTHPDAPFGGFKESGFGRERGRAGIEEFWTTQAVHRTTQRD
ncbi:aldehyde dehydrogenase family protein [Streptomyces sp. YGL11-2]|uniref:aldehyde dehydrogenase family protein n=1 Tax=Streptomyces sp. YGL11-2 TaxID=3414028 RepID=UPI003CF7E9E9